MVAVVVLYIVLLCRKRNRVRERQNTTATEETEEIQQQNYNSFHFRALNMINKCLSGALCMTSTTTTALNIN